jgi:dihydroorotate dehydrogenase electron transfer subunit
MSELTQTGRVLAVHSYPSDYTAVRIQAPACARLIQPGQYLNIDGQDWPVIGTGMDWLDCLQRHSPSFPVGSKVPLTGPMGPAFDLQSATPRALLLGGDGGLAALVFLIARLRTHRPRVKLLLLLHTVTGFPFQPEPSRIMVPGLPPWVIAAMPLLEDWGVSNRLASTQDLPGCFDSDLLVLARHWLEVSQGVADITVYACGPADLLEAARQLATGYRLPCQTIGGVPVLRAGNHT